MEQRSRWLGDTLSMSSSYLPSFPNKAYLDCVTSFLLHDLNYRVSKNIASNMPRPILDPALGQLSWVPPEIRDQIYDEAHNTSQAGYHYAYKGQQKNFARIDRPSHANLSGLARVSKAIRDEFLPRVKLAKNQSTNVYLSLLLDSRNYHFSPTTEALALEHSDCRNLYIDVTTKRIQDCDYVGRDGPGRPTLHMLSHRRYNKTQSIAENVLSLHHTFIRAEKIEIRIAPAPWEPAFTKEERASFIKTLHKYDDFDFPVGAPRPAHVERNYWFAKTSVWDVEGPVCDGAKIVWKGRRDDGEVRKDAVAMGATAVPVKVPKGRERARQDGEDDGPAKRLRPKHV